LEKKVLPLKEGLFHIPSSPTDEPYLIGSKCRVCGYVAFPKKVICPACVRDDTMEETPVGKRANIVSFSLMGQAPRGFTAPYIQAMVRLEEGISIATTLTDCELKEDAVEMGQPVELVITKIKEDDQGNDIIAWKYRPLTKK
jgi:uncharacterized OB-fold protein